MSDAQHTPMVKPFECSLTTDEGEQFEERSLDLAGIDFPLG